MSRQDEIETLSELLQRPETRLLTLTGPGGIGKTRLAIEVAHRIDASLTWSVRFVTLATVERSEDAMPAIAEALEVWDSKNVDLVFRIARSLEGQQTLLVLDNLEQIIDVALDVAQLLEQCPDLTILATSRSPLHIQGEREYSVPQLSLVDTRQLPPLNSLLENESIALFVDRARAVNQDFSLDESNSTAVAEICARLDGLPLAIELAAARTKALPPFALLERLDSQLRILRGDARDLPARLQTMRATVGWSYGLLSDDEKQSFQLLSVFAGDFPLSGACSVLQLPEDEAIDYVSSLLDKSLIIARDPFDDQPFYRMLAVVREFGLEQLANAVMMDNARKRHAEFVAQIVEHLSPRQFRRDQARTFDYLDRIHDSIRQALNWTIDTAQWEIAARISAHLWQYCDVRGNLAEGRRWYERILNADHDYPLSLLPNLYYGFAILTGTPEQAQRSTEMARRLVAIGEETGDRRIVATGKNLIGLLQSGGGGLAESLDSIELWKELDEPVWAGMAAGEVSRWARELGDIDMAEKYAWEAYDTLRETGHIWGFALATSGVGRVLQLQGKTREAMAMFKEGLSLVSQLGDRILVVRFLEFTTEIAAAHRQHARAVRLTAATTRMRELIAYQIRYSAEQAAADRLLDHARAALGETAFAKEWETGTQLSLHETLDEAMAIDSDSAHADESESDSSIRLTRREREVLQRIIAGQTDQEIADELYVSYRTVTTHVTNILNKLGAGSRTEAAAIAVRDRLV